MGRSSPPGRHDSSPFPIARLFSSHGNEVVVSGSLVADLGIGPEIWLFLSLLGCLTLYFKFSRVWSVRNLDLLLLFVLAPGLMSLVANRASEGQPLLPFVLLFLGSAFWLSRGGTSRVARDGPLPRSQPSPRRSSLFSDAAARLNHGDTETPRLPPVGQSAVAEGA